MQTQKKLYQFLSPLVLACVINLLSMVNAYALDISANLDWSKRVELSTPVSGIISSVLVNIGDKVNQGDVLIKLDDRHYVATLNKTKARIKDLGEKRKEAKRELDRAIELYDRTVLSDHDLQIARNAKVAADSEYATAKAELVSAELNLEYASIRAPFKALVLQRKAELGQVVVSQLQPETLIILAAAGEMVAQGYIEQDDLAGHLRGHAATVIVAGKHYVGKVKHVGLEPVKTAKQGIYYEIAIVFDIGDRILRAGQQVTIKLQ